MYVDIKYNIDVLRSNILYILIVVGVIILCGCNSPTKETKVEFSVNVSMDGEGDHSGIEVYLFPGINDLRDLYDINRLEHAKLEPIDVRTLFDHREMTPLYQGVTNQDGLFTFSDIIQGDYTLVYMKEEWGYQYLFDVELRKDTFLEENLILYPVIHINQAIQGDFIFESGKTYIIESNIASLPNSDVVIQSGTNILFNSYTELSITGNLYSPSIGEFGRFSSALGIYEVGQGCDKQGVLRISDVADVTAIEGLVFSYLNEGLKVYKTDFEISRCVFLRTDYACQIVNLSRMLINKCLFFENLNNDAAAFYSYSVDDLSVQRNYFIDNWISILIELSNNCLIEDNLFDSGRFDIKTNWESRVEVTHNEFTGPGAGVLNAGRCDVNITHNDLDKNICIATTLNQNQAGTASFGYTTANNNNFNYKVRAVDSRAMYGNGGEPLVMDFKNNYWNTTSVNEIEDSIYDYYDSPPSPYDHLNWAIIDYNPFKRSRVSDTGIR